MLVFFLSVFSEPLRIVRLEVVKEQNNTGRKRTSEMINPISIDTTLFVGGFIAVFVAEVFLRGRPIVCKRGTRGRIYLSRVMQGVHHLHSYLLLPSDHAVGGFIRAQGIMRIPSAGLLLVSIPFVVPLALVAICLRVLLHPFRSSVVLLRGATKIRTPPSKPQSRLLLFVASTLP